MHWIHFQMKHSYTNLNMRSKGSIQLAYSSCESERWTNDIDEKTQIYKKKCNYIPITIYKDYDLKFI